MRGNPPLPPKSAAQMPEGGERGAVEAVHRPTIGGAGGLRKKGAGIRSWMLVDSTGETQVVEAGKHAIMRRTGLPARDLRILDPVLSYPSSILGREQAIVVNLEHIKAIITAQEVLFHNSRDPLVTPFINKLQEIFRSRHAIKLPQEAEADGSKVEWTNLCNFEESRSMVSSPCQSYPGGFPNKNEQGNPHGEQQVEENAHGLKLLPFEFVALEACIEVACTSLDNEASRLEEEAHPALDKLTTKISTLNLERVRQIKSRLVAITGRVQKVRDELEHLLDDDEDMAEMYLTEKLQQQQLESASASSINELDTINEEDIQPDVEHRTPAEIMTSGDRSSFVSHICDIDIHETGNQQEQPNILRRHSGRTDTISQIAATRNLDVEELEMILEPYFVQIEGTLNKLSTLREYVDDTEDYINIMLDDKQNNLLQMGVVLTTATVVVSAFVALTGVFGMNITIELFDDQIAGMPEFLWTIGGGTAGCVFLYVAAIAWYKYKKFLV